MPPPPPPTLICRCPRRDVVFTAGSRVITHQTRCVGNCCFNTGQTLIKLGQQYSNIGSKPRYVASHRYETALPGLALYKGRTIRYLGGGGGLEFLLLANFFSPPRENNLFFWRSTADNFFFNVSSKKFFVVCFPYYVRYHLVFFLVNIFFIIFDTKLFFLPTFSTNFFFWLLWRQTIFF